MGLEITLDKSSIDCDLYKGCTSLSLTDESATRFRPDTATTAGEDPDKDTALDAFRCFNVLLDVVIVPFSNSSVTS